MYKIVCPGIKTVFLPQLFSFLNLAAKGAEPLEEFCEVHISTAILIKHICKRVPWCDKLKQMVLLGKFWQHLRLSWQGGCSGALEAREAPAGSACQSCQSPACETWWQLFLAMMISGCWYCYLFDNTNLLLRRLTSSEVKAGVSTIEDPSTPDWLLPILKDDSARLRMQCLSNWTTKQ